MSSTRMTSFHCARRNRDGQPVLPLLFQEGLRGGYVPVSLVPLSVAPFTSRGVWESSFEHACGPQCNSHLTSRGVPKEVIPVVFQCAKVYDVITDFIRLRNSDILQIHDMLRYLR